MDSISYQANGRITLSDHLYSLTTDALKKNSDRDRNKVIFDCFVKYIKDNKWKYTLRGRDLRLCPIEQETIDHPLRVNCITLCALLTHVFHRHGCTNLTPGGFQPNPAAPRGSVLKWTITPSMSFFDPEYGKKFERWGNYALFSQHCIVYSNFCIAYDPTFNEIYPLSQKHKNDVTVSPDNPVIRQAYQEYQDECLREGLIENC